MSTIGYYLYERKEHLFFQRQLISVGDARLARYVLKKVGQDSVLLCFEQQQSARKVFDYSVPLCTNQKHTIELFTFSSVLDPFFELGANSV